MFAAVSKLKQHQQRVATLMAHREKLFASGAFSVARQDVLENQVLNHLYVLGALKAESPCDYFKGKSFNDLAELSCDDFCELALASDKQAIFALCATRLIAKPEHDNRDYFLKLKKQHALSYFALLSQQLSFWDIPEQKALRATILEGKESLPEQLKTMLFSQSLNDTELNSALDHNDFTLVYAALVNCYCQRDNSLSDKLFKVFSSTNEPAQKAQLLKLAGLVNDNRWHEPCALFCKAHPEYCQAVLSHYVYKPALVMVIELMAVAQTQEAAYQAWLILTDRPLQKAEPLTLVNAQNQHNVQAGINLHDAEHTRQALALSKGECVLKGISFTNENAAHQLAPLAGKIVQRVLAPKFELTLACGLYHTQQTAKQWLTLLTGAQHAA
ncbi:MULTISPECIES: hypothetical protein [unclassified Pseudoalteromonas]|uniref:hypothetical protein n=1 Tax=unclassified Pseudoalteromonas TaxID=194690 RepID=UPI0018F30E6A|nr:MULTISPECIES: hypothetical protein [unclassified Pseudoalteromonas]MCC9660223.1 hypothetical protein [Pseudoalteromonas sp. MB41]